MPKHQTKFNDRWLDEIDGNGHKLRLWCSKGKTDTTAYCFLCKKTIQCGNAGFAQVLQHSEKSKTHIRLANIACSDSQTKIAFKTIHNSSSIESQASSEVSEIIPVPVRNICVTSKKDDTTKAEIIWAAKTANDNYSFRSSDGIGDTFRAMFSNPETLETFSMSRTKLSYVIGHGFAPVFKEELISDVRASQSPFSLQYDETTQCQVKKQMELHIRYWSPVHNEVWIRYYTSQFFGHAEGATVASAIMSTFRSDDVPLTQLLTLGSDGPNVNRTIWREMEKKIREVYPGFQGLVDVGTCNIHIVHNSFGKGLDKYGKDAEQFVIDLHSLFKYSAARREDFRKLQFNLDVELKLFIEHSSLRWVSIGPGVRRILEQWEAIVQFVKFLESDPKKIPQSAAFKRVQATVKRAEILVQLKFIASTVTLFEAFILNFQNDEPKIHIIYEQMADLMKKFLLRFMKGEKVEAIRAHQLSTLDLARHSQLSDGDLVIGEPTRQELNKLKEDQQKAQLLGIRAFFTAVAAFLQTRLPFENKLLRFLSCLNPDRRSDAILRAIEFVASKLRTPAADIASVSDEWRLYIHDEEIRKPEKGTRVDHYWRDIFKLQTANGNLRYPLLTTIVKAALVLPHGNSDVERGISVNSRMLTSERNKLSEETINGLRNTKDMVKFSDPQSHRPERVPVTKKLLSSVRSAHAAYRQKCEKEKEENERRRKEKEKEEAEIARRQKEMDALKAKNASLLEKETALNEREKELREKLEGVGQLLIDGNSKLKSSVKSSDRAGINAAEVMIETASGLAQKLNAEISEIREKQRNVECQKRKLIEKSLGEVPMKKARDIDSLHKSIKVPFAYSQEKIPASQEDIETPEVARSWKHLEGIADHIHHCTNTEIGLLIGHNIPSTFQPLRIIYGTDNEHWDEEYKFGWTVIGPVCLDKREDRRNYETVNCIAIRRENPQKVFNVPTSNSSKEDPVVSFATKHYIKDVTSPQQVEEMMQLDYSELQYTRSIPGTERSQSVEDKRFRDTLTANIHKNEKGNWEMPLPFKTSAVILPNNCEQCLKRLLGIKRKLLKNSKTLKHYTEFMQKIFDKNHASPIPSGELKTSAGKVWYLPHFDIYHPKKQDQIPVLEPQLKLVKSNLGKQRQIFYNKTSTLTTD
ncbi:hypothetical protein AWC38_SpisGene22936 [Stylophora pistillata]|uniref:Uncharacterized protein n=1 Tax=Stylophora pistillata TaxID=50429 RepID=A0A2B4R3W2_STYPI|nr:hypothetical protein AWC38_SpisGene22936 [Stylophora pistillata]